MGYVVARFKKNSNAPMNKGTAPRNTGESTLCRYVLQHMLLPCFLTTTTTAVGFLSTLVAEVHSSKILVCSGHRRDDGLCHDHLCTEHARHTFATTRKKTAVSRGLDGALLTQHVSLSATRKLSERALLWVPYF